jgi:hypothetical protein
MLATNLPVAQPGRGRPSIEIGNANNAVPVNEMQIYFVGCPKAAPERLKSRGGIGMVGQQAVMLSR